MLIDYKTSSVSAVPKYIQESWKRCQNIGLNVTAFDNEHFLGEFELKEYYLQYDEVLFYSSSILKDVYKSIQGTDFLLLFATPEGYIIDTIGDPSFIRYANNIALRKGANWLEESKGTNAIGTAIVERQPVLVHGSQHYCQDNKYLTCAAAPILDSDGQLLGVLNLSSHQQNFHPHTLGLVKRAAQCIEQAINYAHTQKQLKNVTSDLDFIYNYNPSSLITINNDGYVTRLNYAAARTIGCSEQAMIGKPISNIIEGHDLKAIRGQRVSFNNQVFTPHIVTNENSDQTCVLLRGETKQQNSELTNRYHFPNIISNDSTLNDTMDIAKRCALLDMSILITGETGTGKELFAQSIHGASLRSFKPFIAINCSAIPESLLESELFGYEKGAFTGAKSQGHAGKFETANGGTLFLDEIGDMPITAQATLLRVLQEGCITRVGGITPRPIDVRIIAATHKDLQKEIEAGRFRADLYFRLNGFTLKLPSLRNRTDIIMLAEDILSKISFKKEIVELTSDAKTFISEYDWPGNFRQLKNILQQAAFITNNRITKSLLMSLCPSQALPIKMEQTEKKKMLSLRENEILLIQQVLEQTNGNISRASTQLKIGRNTLYRKLKEYNLMS